MGIYSDVPGLDCFETRPYGGRWQGQGGSEEECSGPDMGVNGEVPGLECFETRPYEEVGNLNFLRLAGTRFHCVCKIR